MDGRHDSAALDVHDANGIGDVIDDPRFTRRAIADRDRIQPYRHTPDRYRRARAHIEELQPAIGEITDRKLAAVGTERDGVDRWRLEIDEGIGRASGGLVGTGDEYRQQKSHRTGVRFHNQLQATAKQQPGSDEFIRSPFYGWWIHMT